MAGNRIDIDLSVQDQSRTLQTRTNDAKKLNEQLERSQNLMRGTKTGAGAMRRAGLDPMTGAEVGEYNRARGAAGAGGASARDFADQARGLGGLVRLYATYAANIFAVTAAFNALREAMQTDMMIRSLDQLGSATGTAMGGIAKQFAAASGGAISLREAAEATAKAMSSGMTRDQFLQLGEVAKGAAQALGLNMSDAVSRLTRGITKLEPELLDELGLFTKVGKAAEDYARSVGKTEAQLTDFERRQAFANAVLKEGKDKFGEIAQEGNPYDRLLAELKNVAQDILTVVNNLVAPIAKLLADNTGLIAGAIGLAALKITKTALPALGQWRAGLEVAAKDAAEKAADINRSFQEAFVTKQEKALGIPGLQKNLDEAKRQLKVAQQELLGASTGMDRRVAGSKWFGAATSEDVANEKSITKLQETSAKYAQSESADKQKIAAAMVKVADAQKLVLERSQALANVDDTLQEGLQKRARVLSELWQREQIRDQAAAKAARLRILSEVSGDVDSKGFAGGIKELYGKAQANEDLGRLGKFATVFQGVMIASARAVAILGSALSRAFFYIEIIIATFLTLDSLFSTNAKSVREFDNRINVLEENTKTANQTLEKFKGVLSFESIIASINAFTGLSEAINNVAESFRKAEQASSRWDKSIDAIKDFLPGLSSRQEIAAENLGGAVAQAIRTVPEGAIRDELQNRLQSILGNVELSAEGIEKALNKLDKESFRSVSKVLGLTLKDTDEVLKKSQTLAKNVEEAGKAAQTSYQNLANSVKDNSPLTVFIQNNLKRVQSLEEAFKDTTAARAALDKLSKEGGVEFFGSFALQIKQLTVEFDSLNNLSKEYSTNIFEQEQEVKKLQDSMKGLYATDPIRKRLEKELKSTVDSIDYSKGKLAEVESKIASIQQRLADTIQGAVLEQINRIFEVYDLRLQKIRIDAEKARASIGTGTQTKASIDYRAQLDIKAIDTENQLAKINEDLVLKTELNKIALENLTDQLELNRLESIKQTSPTNLRKLEEIAPKITALEQKRETVTSMRDEATRLVQAAQGGDRGALSALKELVKRPGGSGFLPLVDMLQKKLERDLKTVLDKQNIEAKRIFDNIGLSFDLRIRDLNNTLTTANQQLQSVSGLLTPGGNQQLQVLVQDIKNAADVLEIEKKIAQETQLKNIAVSAGEKASRQAVIDRLTGEREVLRVQQNQKRQADLALAIETRRLEAIKHTIELRQMELEIFEKIFETDPTVAESFRRELYSLKESEAREVSKSNVSRLREAISQQQQTLANLGELGINTERNQATAFEIELLKSLEEQLDRVMAKESTRQFTKDLEEASRRATFDREQELRIIEQINTANLNRLDIENQFLDIERERQGLQREAMRASLDLRTQMGVLTQDEINKENIRIRQLELQSQLQEKLNSLNLKQAQVQADLAVLNAQVVDSDMGGTTAPPGVQQRIKYLEDQLKVIDRAKQLANEYSQVQNKILDEQQRFDDRTKFYGDSFKRMFEGMADAIVEFAKTGKFNFKDLINNFIADITRYELKLQATEAYAASRPFLLKFLGSIFGGGSTYGANYDAAANPSLYGGVFAMGGAFNRGIQAYANGGMFTNSIVNQPTFFRAAQGLGVMGEAGPEAIMPLKRDSQGNLGVRSSQGNVEVVVNNFTQARAETRETTDSRGNRRIEVIVADLVAGEISRPNSNIQQSFVNSFGTKPMVARR